jgi:hypothetical protein
MAKTKKDKDLQRIAELAREYHRFAQLEKEGKQGKEGKDGTGPKGEIISYMITNNVKELMVDGYRIVLTDGKDALVSFDIEGFERDLPKKVFEQITDRSINKDALLSAVNRGIVPRKLLKKHTSTSDKSPYITVTPKD